MNFMEGLFLRILITICLYTILTLPYILYYFIGFGVNYGKYGCLVASFVAVVLSPIIHSILNKRLNK